MKVIAGLGAVLLVLLVPVPAHTETSPDAALDALHRAGAEATPSAFISLLADDVVFLGMAGSTRLQGAAVREFVNAGFSDGGGWAYRSSDREVQLSTDGSVAWFDEALSHQQQGSGRGSGVLVRDGGNWLVAQYNLTVPLPSDAAQSPGLRSLLGAEAAPPAGPPSPECRALRHKTNKKGGC